MPRKKKEEINVEENIQSHADATEKISNLIKEHKQLKKQLDSLEEKTKLLNLRDDIMQSKLDTFNNKFLYFELLVIIISILYIIYQLIY